MKIKLALFLLFVICQEVVFSQTHITDGILLNPINNTPIPFATIADHTTGKFMLSDSTGKFSFSVSIGDSLTISHIAYQSMTIKIDSDQHIFYLKQKKRLLDEVVVVGRKAIISKVHLGYDLTKSTNSLDLQKNYRHAVYIQNNGSSRGIIKYIHFNIQKLGKCHNGIRILIFNVDTTDIKKSIVLLCKPIELPFEKIKHRNNVDVSSLSIPFPLNGILVSMEPFNWDEPCPAADIMLLRTTTNITGALNLVGWGNNAWELMKYPDWKQTPQIGVTVMFKH